MVSEITVQLTSQGLRIPCTALKEWQDAELEVVCEDENVIVRPKLVMHKQQLGEPVTQYEVSPPATESAAQITTQGIFIPRTMVESWQEIEVVTEPQRIVIQPKATALTEHERVIQIVEDCGFLLSSEPLPKDYVPLSEEEKEELRQALSVGKPLSEIVLEDREERW